MLHLAALAWTVLLLLLLLGEEADSAHGPTDAMLGCPPTTGHTTASVHGEHFHIDPMSRRPFASAQYTYHAGTFDVHRQDTSTLPEDNTMVSAGYFAFVDNVTSSAMETDFWAVVDEWEQHSQARFAQPVLGVERPRIRHTMQASRLKRPWTASLLDSELEEFKALGFRQARLSFAWLDAEPNWEQLGLQYLYVEYLAEAKRLNSGISPRNMTTGEVNSLYLVPLRFSEFVRAQRYDVEESIATQNYARPPSSASFRLNYTELAPGLRANWQLDVGREVFFTPLQRPVLNRTFITVRAAGRMPDVRTWLAQNLSMACPDAWVQQGHPDCVASWLDGELYVRSTRERDLEVPGAHVFFTEEGQGKHLIWGSSAFLLGGEERVVQVRFDSPMHMATLAPKVHLLTYYFVHI